MYVTSVVLCFPVGLGPGFPHSSVGKKSACNAGDPSSIPGWEDLLEKGEAIHSKILGLPLWLSW